MRVNAGAAAGFYPLQHHGHVKDGYTVDLRANVLGVRISGRTPPLGRWKIKKGDYGDLQGALFLQTAGRDKRPIGSFWLTGVPVVVQAPPPVEEPKPPDTPTQSADPYSQAGNPFGPDGRPKPPPPKQPVGTSNPPAAAPEPAPLCLLPAFDSTWKADLRYLPVQIAAPKSAAAARLFAPGTRGLVVAGSQEDSQEAVFVPAGGDLVAVNWAGPPECGTIVSDLNEKGEIDPNRGATLQTLTRVVRFGEKNSLAWNIFRTGRNENVGGYVTVHHRVAWDATSKTPPPGNLGTYIGHVSNMLRGPFIVPADPQDQHLEGLDADLHPIYPVHLALNTLWRADNFYQAPDHIDVDGPFKFDGLYQKATRGPHAIEVDFKWDPSTMHDWIDGKPRRGVLRWEAWGAFYEPTPSKPPPPPQEPPFDPGQPGHPFPPHGPVQQPPPEEPEDPPEDIPFGFLIPGSLRIMPDGRLTGDVIGPGEDFLPGQEGIKVVPQPGESSTAPQGPGIGADTSPGRRRELGQFSVDLRRPIPNVYTRGATEPRRFTAATTETAFPAVLFRAQMWRRGAPWLTNWMAPWPEIVADFDRSAPVVARFEAYGAQGGTRGQDILDGSPSGDVAGDPWAYTLDPQAAPYPGGTAPGGVVLLPPEVGLWDIDIDFAPADVDVSTAYLTLPASIARLGFGKPDLVGGGILLGNEIFGDSTGKLHILKRSSVGAVVEDWTWPTADGSAGQVIQTDGAGALTFGSPGMQALYSTATQTGTAADLVETSLASYTVPAATLSAATPDSLIIRAWGSFAANGNVKTIRLRIGAGSTIIATNDVTAAPNGVSWKIEAKLIVRTANTETCIGQATVGAVAQSCASTLVNTAIANTIAVTLTGQNGTAAANDIVLDGFEVEKA